MAEHPLRLVLAALGAGRRRELAFLTLLTLLAAAGDLLLVAASVAFLAVLAGGPATSLPVLGALRLGIEAAALLFGAAAILANFLRVVTLRLTEQFTAGVTHELTVDVQRRVLAQPYDYHVRHHSSEVIASLDKVRLVVSYSIQAWLQGIAASAAGLGILLVLASIDPLPALAGFAAMAIVYVVAAQLASSRLARNSLAIGTAYDERIRKVQEGLGAIRDVIIDHGEGVQLKDFRRADIRLAQSQASTQTIAALPRYIVEVAAILLACLLAARFASREDALVLIGGIAVGGLRVLPLLQAAYRGWAQLKASRLVLDDVTRLLNLPVRSHAGPMPEPLPFNREVTIRKVVFHYPDRPDPLLDNLSFELRVGERVALVGETGSGKSTLADLLMGLLRPVRGSLEVDGIVVTDAKVRAWQRNIAHVAQNIFLADASIARNIAFSVAEEQLDLGRAREAAAQAEIADFIETLPDGYDTAVGERGVRLSGGQRQRVGIARALYKNAPLLVLDEATNALDAETEARVLANVFANAERTILLIAHRPSALNYCDRILRLRAGRLVSEA